GRIEKHAAEQEARARRARETTDSKQALGNTLLGEYLRPLSRIAGTLFKHDPAVRRGFDLPRRRNTEGLMQVASAIADRAEEHQALFTAQGLAPDFVERLRTAIANYRETIVSRGLDVGRRSAASAGLLNEMRRGRELVRVIDDMLAPRLGADPDQYAEWKTIARFTRRPVVVEGGVSGPAPTPAGAPIPAPGPAPARADVVSIAPVVGDVRVA
ncbi:MAG: hypothetical protein ABI910_02990, partial [Gemmatimonadota bacterium]